MGLERYLGQDEAAKQGISNKTPETNRLPPVTAFPHVHFDFETSLGKLCHHSYSLTTMSELAYTPIDEIEKVPVHNLPLT